MKIAIARGKGVTGKISIAASFTKMGIAEGKSGKLV